MTHTKPNSATILWLLPVMIIYLNSCNGSSGPANWPQFRGPGADMVVNDDNLPAEWGEEQGVRDFGRS